MPTHSEAVRYRQTVAAILVEMDFPTGKIRAWTGRIPLLNVLGYTWQPVGEIGVIDMPETTAGFQNNALRLGFRRPANFDALDYNEFVTAAQRDARTDIAGRAIKIMSIVFDVETGEQIGVPEVIFTGQMSHFEQERERGDYAIVIVAETYLAGGYLPPSGRWTDADQQDRFPGDRGFELVPKTATRRVFWPLP